MHRCMHLKSHHKSHHRCRARRRGKHKYNKDKIADRARRKVNHQCKVGRSNHNRINYRAVSAVKSCKAPRQGCRVATIMCSLDVAALIATRHQQSTLHQ